MAEKKGFWATLFGGGCDCGMEVEEAVAPKKKTKKGGCCDMQILEEVKKVADTEQINKILSRKERLLCSSQKHFPILNICR